MDIQNISKLMKKHWDGQIPVDVKKIAKSMNIELIPMNFDESYKTNIKTRIMDDGTKKRLLIIQKVVNRFVIFLLLMPLPESL